MSKWTNEQLEAINKSGSNIIVSAGAGSGKTAVLTERTITKLLNGTNINRLLILTFTNMAAGEMKERIRKAIISANMVEQLDYLDSAYITTFDSFSLSVVKKYHLELGLDKNINIMDSSEITLKTYQILNDIFESSYGNHYFDKLIGDFCSKSDDLIKEIFIKLSNKLDLLTTKNEYLNNYIDIHYSNEYIEKDIDKYLKEILKVRNDIIDNYHNLELYVDKTYLDKFNLYPLLNSNDYDTIKESLSLIGSPRKNKNCSEDYKIYKDNITKLIKKLIELTRFDNLEEIKSTILDTKDYVIAVINIKKEFDKRFLEYKRSINSYTFNDIALMAINIVKNNSKIRKELTDSFDEIMIDEYQDTSDIQEEFINLISNNNLYMVGDIKQSIYRFRNANPYIFRNKYKKYSNNEGGIKIDLLKNFRSRSEVLDNINLIFNLIMDNEIGDADYIESHQMNFGNISYSNELKTNDNHNMEIITYNKEELEEYSKDEIEAFTVLYDIKQKLANHYQVVDKETNKLRDATYKDFSIIMDRGTSFDLYKKIFEYSKVPISQIKNEKLTSGVELQIFSNLIKLIVKINEKKYDNEFKYLFVSISRSYLLKLTDEEIFDIVNSKTYYQTKLYNICKNINIYELTNIELIDRIINDFNVYNQILTTNNIKETLIRIDYLKQLAINFTNNGYTILEFANYLEEMLEKDTIEYSLNSDNSNTVKILNIHKSKGLEYNICYFTGLSKKSNDADLKEKFLVDSNYNIITPYIKDGLKQNIYKDLLILEEKKKMISEKIRLFYVALTRTKEKFIIVSPIDYNKESFNSLVDINTRLNYNSLSDILDSISKVLEPYIKQIDLNKVLLTKDYDQKPNYNINQIPKENILIEKRHNNIKYEILNQDRYSKKTNKLNTLEEYNNMLKGEELHYIFETEDFKTSNNSYIKNFINNIDLNYLNIYKEHEFIYEQDNESRHGIIDLILEYKDKINIIDYKMKNITDTNYLKQLEGYKTYIEKISNKKVETYLYSILDNKLEKLC